MFSLYFHGILGVVFKSSISRAWRRLMIHPSWIGLGRWSNSCSVGFTTVLARGREANADRTDDKFVTLEENTWCQIHLQRHKWRLQKEVDVISRPPGCARQAADSRRSISLFPSKSGGCSKIMEIPKSECPHIWIRLPRHKWPKS